MAAKKVRLTQKARKEIKSALRELAGLESGRYEDQIQYKIGFRGPKRALNALFDAMLSRADGESFFGKMCINDLAFDPDVTGKMRISGQFGELAEEDTAQFANGGTLWQQELYGYLRELLVLVPELEACAVVRDFSDDGIFIETYYYSEAGSAAEVMGRRIHVACMSTYEETREEIWKERKYDYGYNEDDETWNEEEEKAAFFENYTEEDYYMNEDFFWIPVLAEELDAELRQYFGRPKAYFDELMDREFRYELRTVYKAALKNTDLFDRPERVAALQKGDVLFLSDNPGERDNEAGIGAPCLALRTEAGSVGVLGANKSEYILCGTAALCGIQAEHSSDIQKEDIDPLLKQYFSAKVTAVAPALKVEIRTLPELLRRQLTSDSPALDAILCRLRDKLLT